jgi:superfamily II DNA or RNA helicase
MSAPELRPYQQELIERIDAAIAAGYRRLLVVAPTGAGKTVVAAALIGDAVGRGQCCQLLAHRRELIGLASGKLYAAGIDHGVILAGFPPRLAERVQVASIATLHARAIRTSAMDLPPAELIIVDEAHHAPSRTYRRLLEAYPEAVTIGITATPTRSDGRGLGDIFEILIECPPVVELIAGGFLVGTKVFAPTTPDLEGVRVARGDYVERELAPRMDQAELVGDIVSHWHRLAERRRTVVFASSVGHSVHLRDEFRRGGVVAEHIDGSTPADERDAILAGLSTGNIEAVTNYGVLTEGWDSPSVSCVVLARPTKHHGLFRQMIGRVLRPVPGKTDAIVLDHAGATFEHGFIEEPVRWTLSPNRRAETPALAARAKSHAPALVTCPECSAVRLEGKPCSVCGWRPRPKAVAVDVAEGELGLLDRNRVARPIRHDELDRHRFHCQLAHIGRERGYQPGWAAHRERFGAWPEARNPEPLPPDEAVRAWVRSRAIAWAKGQQKAGAA